MRNQSFLAVILAELKKAKGDSFKSACHAAGLEDEGVRSQYVTWGKLVRKYPIFGEYDSF